MLKLLRLMNYLNYKVKMIPKTALLKISKPFLTLNTILRIHKDKARSGMMDLRSGT